LAEPEGGDVFAMGWRNLQRFGVWSSTDGGFPEWFVLLFCGSEDWW
jgi:hypothetical protein